MRRRTLTLLAAATAVALTAAATAVPANARPAQVVGSHAKGFSHAAASAAATTATPLLDKGGLVLTTSTTYAIYWGPTTGFPTDLQAGMTALLSGFSGSTYLATANQYMRGKIAATTYGGSFVDTSAPPTKNPSTTVIAAEVAKVLTANKLATNPNAIYMVFSSNLPKVNYCAWHAGATVNAVKTQIAYMPNTALTTGCYPTANLTIPAPAVQYSYGTRSIADNTAHEFMEAITDPQPSTGWVDSAGAEIGDKCNFVYNSLTTLSGTNNVWQIQAEWSNAINGCAQTTP